MTGHGADLVVESVSHRYGTAAVLDDVSVSVSPGQIHSLLGPSGSGKTTLLRLVAGLERLEHGRILIGGAEVAGAGRHVPPEERAIGFVFQDYALFPHLSVRDNVLFGLSRKRRPEGVARADELLSSVGMASFARAMPHTLSGGQQQRVALARALAHDPRVMLLDEPFSGLDARLRGEIRQIAVDLLRANRVATLMVTHDPPEALQVSDVVSVIRSGRIDQTGAPFDVYFQPRTLAVAEILGPANRLSGRIEHGRVATPWGDLAAPHGIDRSRVVVLVRPEGLVLHTAPQGQSVPAVVRHTALKGETCRVEIELGTGQTLIASIPSYETETWFSGAAVHVSLAPGAAVVLPED